MPTFEVDTNFAADKSAFGAIRFENEYDDDGNLLQKWVVKSNRPGACDPHQAIYFRRQELNFFKHAYPNLNVENRANKQGEVELWMPYLGVSLLSYFTDNPQASEKSVLEIYTSIFTELQRICELEIIHRDIRPQNILIDPKTKKISIIDAAFSVNYDSQTPYAPACPAYTQPKLLSKKTLPAANGDDIYSLMRTIQFCNSVVRCGSELDDKLSELFDKMLNSDRAKDDDLQPRDAIPFLEGLANDASTEKFEEIPTEYNLESRLKNAGIGPTEDIIRKFKTDHFYALHLHHALRYYEWSIQNTTGIWRLNPRHWSHGKEGRNDILRYIWTIIHNPALKYSEAIHLLTGRVGYHTTTSTKENSRFEFFKQLFQPYLIAASKEQMTLQKMMHHPVYRNISQLLLGLAVIASATAFLLATQGVGLPIIITLSNQLVCSIGIAGGAVTSMLCSASLFKVSELGMQAAMTFVSPYTFAA